MRNRISKGPVAHHTDDGLSPTKLLPLHETIYIAYEFLFLSSRTNPVCWHITHNTRFALYKQKAELDRTLLQLMGYLSLPLHQIPQQKHSWDIRATSHAHVAVFLRYNDGNSIRETIRNIEIITEPILTAVSCCTTYACIIRRGSWESVSARVAEIAVAHVGNHLRQFLLCDQW